MEASALNLATEVLAEAKYSKRKCVTAWSTCAGVIFLYFTAVLFAYWGEIPRSNLFKIIGLIIGLLTPKAPTALILTIACIFLFALGWAICLGGIILAGSISARVSKLC